MTIALSVRQPKASKIASGEKTIELRSWRTHYRGPLLICASSYGQNATDGLLRGVALALVDLVDCVPARPELAAAACVSSLESDECWCWIMENPRPVAPFPVKGNAGLFHVPGSSLVAGAAAAFPAAAAAIDATATAATSATATATPTSF